jgi:hypothetical protein
MSDTQSIVDRSRIPVPVENLIWLAVENRAMLLCHEGSLQAYWLDGSLCIRPVPI